MLFKGSAAAMPPACDSTRLEKSSWRKRALFSSPLNRVLTAGSTLKGRFLSTSTNLGMSRGLGMSVACAPWRITSRHRVSAKMWYSGNAMMWLA